MNQIKNNQGGFTLLELLLVIGLATLLLIASIYTYRMITEGTKATASTRLLMSLHQQAINTATQQESTYTGLAYDDTAAAGAAAGGLSPFVVSGLLHVNERNPFDGPIVITPTGGGTTLTMSFGKLSKPACMRLIQAITSSSELISVGTAAATYTGTANQIPVSAANAAAACNQSSNTVTWVFP